MLLVHEQKFCKSEGSFGWINDHIWGRNMTCNYSSMHQLLQWQFSKKMTDKLHRPNTPGVWEGESRFYYWNDQRRSLRTFCGKLLKHYKHLLEYYLFFPSHLLLPQRCEYVHIEYLNFKETNRQYLINTARLCHNTVPYDTILHVARQWQT